MPYINHQNKLLQKYLACQEAEVYRFFMLQTRKIVLYVMLFDSAISVSDYHKKGT